ncbi:hypothetical protein F2Q68_00034836 [Brassica cretica]|uniref:Uncharacterized protein n=1 Tax=Brassica cretica TaxID=69181 RepID=A0A8S9H3C5_BRACR|nr:hypothetical protein F2Q68_00034836 [Brassica cretica]
MFVTLSFWIPWFRYSLLRRKPHGSHRVIKEAGHAAYKKDVETTIKHYSTTIEIDDEEISLITNRHAIHLKMERMVMKLWLKRMRWLKKPEIEKKRDSGPEFEKQKEKKERKH